MARPGQVQIQKIRYISLPFLSELITTEAMFFMMDTANVEDKACDAGHHRDQGGTR